MVLIQLNLSRRTSTNTTSAAPAGTAALTSKMMGLAGSITPNLTGNILIVISGQMANDTINDGATVDARQGTGAAPANGDAVTGTLVGISQTVTALVAAERSGFCISGVVTGLTLGTAVWIDASVKAITAGTATITGVSISAFEI